LKKHDLGGQPQRRRSTISEVVIQSYWLMKILPEK